MQSGLLVEGSRGRRSRARAGQNQLDKSGAVKAVTCPSGSRNQNGAPAKCRGTSGYWGGMCLNCRRDPTVYARDPCVAKYFENGAGRSNCYGPNDTRGVQCVTCAGKLDKRKLPEGSASSKGGKVRSASQLAKCPGCGRQVKACRKAHRENKAPSGKLEICQACS